MPKPQKTERTYVYLARRNKQSVRVVTVLPSLHIARPERIDSPAALPLPDQVVETLTNISREHKMDWEMWAETATSYEDLKTRLEKRGYRTPDRMRPMV